MFSYAFGRADSRESCVESAQSLYFRLLQGSSAETLRFETLATIALQTNGKMQNSVLRDLVTMFRPDRDGFLTMIDFVKSVDYVYKKIRFLRASIHNAQKIDRAFEVLVNVVYVPSSDLSFFNLTRHSFYVVLSCVILSRLGFDPLALFLSLSSVVVAFAFMIGTASAKYFDGLLFIMLQKPCELIKVCNLAPYLTQC